MPHFITALFDSQAGAERALQTLLEAGIARDRATIIGTDEGREVSSISGFRELSARDDLLAALDDLSLPDRDRAAFARHLEQGCALLNVRVERSEIGRTVEVLELLDPLDIDDASAGVARGTSGQDETDAGAPLGAGLSGGGLGGSTNTAAIPGMGAMTDGTGDIGSAELRTDEMSTSNMGLSATETGSGQAEERAGTPGVLELRKPGRVRVYGRD